MSVGLRAAALGLAAVLLGGAFVLGQRGNTEFEVVAPEPTTGSSEMGADRLADLRAAAALAPCPAGLGSAFPDLVLPCLGGGPSVALQAAPPGRPTLVNVWGSWCGPCAEEMPDLVAFAERAGDRVGLVGVLTTDTQERGLAFSRDFGVRWPSVVDDDGAVLRAFLPGPPVTLFVDADGVVVHRKSGKFSNLAELEALVAVHLGVAL